MNRWLRASILVIFSALAVYSLIYILRTSLSPAGGIDFHSYWYSGHFLRQCADPYQAYLNQETPSTPVRYLDLASPFEGEVAQPGLANVPANTAPVVLILGLFSFFSWPTAKLLWLLLNITFLLLLPGLLARWLRPRTRYKPTELLLITLLLFSLFGTRNSAVNGQTSIFVYLLMLVSLVTAQRSPGVSGVALGVAFSKYSLSLPVLLLFLSERRWKLLAIATLVQVFALLGISSISHQSPISILAAYAEIMYIHTSMSGIHLASLFSPASPAGGAAALLLSLLVLAALLAAGMSKENARFSIDTEFYRQNNRPVFDILLLWTLLVAYHRAYDSFVALTVLVNSAPYFQISLRNEGDRSWSKLANFGAALAGVVLILPASGFLTLLNTLGFHEPGAWLQMHNNLITLVLLILLLVKSVSLIKSGRRFSRW